MTELPRYVGRGGIKLAHALETFGIDPSGLVCADFGCNVGGFTDCLLQRGANRIYAVDTGYGALAYTLRIDPRVVVMERTNAMHAPSPEGETIELIAIDMAWTVQSRCIEAALRWLAHTDRARVLSLVKPHYEAKGLGMADRLVSGVLSEGDAQCVLEKVVESLPSHGVEVLGTTKSPIAGGGSKRNKAGNIEYLIEVRRAADGPLASTPQATRAAPPPSPR